MDALQNPEEGRPKHARAWSLVLLAALAVAGNLLSVDMLFGIRFFFGGVAALLALRLHGPVAGLLIGALAATVAYSQGAGPWIVPVLILEVVVVGLLLRRPGINLLVADAVYWVLLGLPLGAVLESTVAGQPGMAIAAIALKQAVNGIACALLASAVATHVPALRRLAGDLRPDSVSLRDTLFHLFVALVLGPTLALLVVAGRLELAERRNVLVSHLRAATSETQTHLSYWIDHHRGAITTLADSARGLTEAPSAHLQDTTRLLTVAFPDFRNIYVADADGRTVAFHPPVNERGESTIGLDFSDRPYYHDLVRQLAPVTSEVFLGRGGVFDPIVTVSAPVLVAGRFAGFALGALNLEHLADLLADPLNARGVELTLIDAVDRVVASSVEGRTPLEPRSEPGPSWPRVYEGKDLYRLWPPATRGRSDFARWQAAREVVESPVGEGIPWTLVAEAPLADLQEQVLGLYVRDLVVMLVLSLFTLLLARGLSAWVVRPLRELAQHTRDLPSRLTSLDAPPPAWPPATETEVAALIDNFRSMTTALSATFQSLRERTAELARTNEELRSEGRERLVLEAHVRQKQALESLGTLAGGIAHDFNNVLTTVLGNVELARRTAPSDPDLAEALTEIERAGERAGDLVQQILTFSRRGGTGRRVVSLADATEDALRLLRSSLHLGVRLDARLAAGTALVHADPTQLFQVVTNLCTNAEHALRGPGGQITVEVTEEEDPVSTTGARLAVLCVSDDGPGMAPEVQERAFEPFFTTKPPGEGSGMGLAVVHGIVQEHGGAVEIDSTPGHGATIRVRLPLVQVGAPEVTDAPGADAPAELSPAEPPPAELSPVEPPPVEPPPVEPPPAEPPPVEPPPAEPSAGKTGPPEGTVRVLLAEDESSIARLVCESLEAVRCTVVAFADGRDALEAFLHDDRGFDVVVTDLAMPGMGGAALIRAVRARSPQVGVVLVTGYRDALPDAAVTSLDIDRVVLKPFRAADLAREVREVAEARARRATG